VLHAQEPSATLTPTTAVQEGNSSAETINGGADYAPAFQKLIALGFPDARGATYIQLEFATSERDREGSQQSYERFEINRSGNAWLLPAKDPQSPAREVIHRGSLVAKVASMEKRNLIVRLFAGDDDKTRNGLRKAEWTEVDPAEEVTKILAQFETDESLAILFDRERWSYDLSAVSSLGDLLMMACHLHQAGHTGEGNKLADYILSKAPYPFKVIDHIVGQLASAEYHTLLDNLYENQDWEAFLKGIRTLSTKYPRGWADQPGLKILIHQVVSHVRTGKKNLVPFKGQPLNPNITQALEQILSPEDPASGITATAPTCWIFNPENKLETDYGDNLEVDPLMSSIVKDGLAAFPTLIAASADPTLIPAPFYGPQSRYREYSMDFGNSGRNELDLEQAAYQRMARPSTRGEIARSIIQQTLPAGNTDWSAFSPEELQLLAYDWWLTNKDKPLAEIAILFLEKGDEEQESIALQAILESNDEKAFPAIESYILQSDSLMQEIELVKKYLKRRRNKGREFHDTFVAKLREEFDTRFSEQGNSDQIEQYFQQTTSSLAILVDDVSPEKLMAEISSGKRTAEQGFPLLAVAIGEGAYLQQFDTLLTFISSLENPNERLLGLANLQNWIDRETRDASELDPESETLTDHQKNVRNLASTHLKTWQTFLGRNETLTLPAKQLANYRFPPSEAHYAAVVMMGIHFPEANQLLRSVSEVASAEEIWALNLDQINRFAQSGQAPVIPQARIVPKDRQDALLAKVRELPTHEIIPYRKSLNLAERLALDELLASLADVPATIAALAKVCQTIQWDRGFDIPADLRDQIEAVVIGQELSNEMVAKTFETLSKHEAGLVLIFQPSGGSLRGPRIMAWSTKTSVGWLENQIPDELAKLDGEKAPRLESLLTFGIDRESQAPLNATRFLPSENPARDKTTFDDLLRQALPLFEPSGSEDQYRTSQSGFALATETFEGYQSSHQEDEGDEEDTE